MLLLALVALAACTREVAVGLDERDANLGLLALARAGVEADKELDTDKEGAFRLRVPLDDAPFALAVLAREDLPRRTATAASSSLFPMPEAERGQWVSDAAMRLERSLLVVDGVVDARVHLDVPMVDPMRVPPSLPTAAVLLRVHGELAISTADLRRLVASSVAGLDVDHVAIVVTPVADPSASPLRALVRFGPLVPARASLTHARIAVFANCCLLLVLGATVLVLVWRLRTTRHALEAAVPVSARD